jgi:hypothetical protein
MVSAMSGGGGAALRGGRDGAGSDRRGGAGAGGTDFRMMRRARPADTDGRSVVGSRSPAISFDNWKLGRISVRAMKGRGTPCLRKSAHSAPLGRRSNARYAQTSRAISTTSTDVRAAPAAADGAREEWGPSSLVACSIAAIERHLAAPAVLRSFLVMKEPTEEVDGPVSESPDTIRASSLDLVAAMMSVSEEETAGSTETTYARAPADSIEVIEIEEIEEIDVGDIIEEIEIAPPAARPAATRRATDGGVGLGMVMFALGAITAAAAVILQ